MEIPSNGEAVRDRSVWSTALRQPRHPELSSDTKADVCVVGAGIAGLTTAYLLTRSGRSVVVLEGRRVGSGETGSTTAHLSSAIDDSFVEIERIHGSAGAELAARSHAAAIDQIEAIVAAERIDCGFERLDGYLFAAPGDEHEIAPELGAALRAGLSVERMSSAPLDGFQSGPCLCFRDQAQFHPLAYTSALTRAIVACGGRIFEGTHVDRVRGGSPARVHAGPWVVTADAVVVATNVPFNDRVTIHTKQSPYTTYVIGAGVPRGSVKKALYWDTADPYHYVRLESARATESGIEGDVLIVGGEDHRTGEIEVEPGERYKRLEHWARERFPSIQSVEFRWAGQVMETLDGLAFIGRNPLDDANVFVITGDSGMGMTHGTLGAMLVRDLITGCENPWEALYEPSRKPLRALGTYVREALDMASHYGD